MNTWCQRINLSTGSDGALADRAAFGPGGSEPSFLIVLFCLLINSSQQPTLRIGCNVIKCSQYITSSLICCTLYSIMYDPWGATPKVPREGNVSPL